MVTPKRHLRFTRSGSAFDLVLMLLVGVLLINLTWPAIVSAASLSQDDKEAIVGNWPHWTTQNFASDTSTTGGGTCGGSNGATDGGKVYFLGDSIGVRTTPALTTALSAKGFKLKSDSLSSRTLSGGSVSPDGLTAARQAADKAFIKTANVIVIELGTNSSGFSNANIDKLISEIRPIAQPGAKFYWVDTVVVGRGNAYASSFSATNQTIYGHKSIGNYAVISWNKKVLGANANPLNIRPSAVDTNGYIDKTDHLGVHPTVPKGSNALANLITTAVVNGGGGCSGGGTVAGNCNEDKVWNFFIGKGLSQVATAGIMGNFQAESHFEPRLVQYGGRNYKGQVSVQGQPSSLADYLNADGTTGYGIAQWTAIGRQTGLHNYATSKKTIDGNLTTQLGWAWTEITSPYFAHVYLVLKTSKNIAEINSVFGHEYEGYGTNTEATRLQFGQDILNALGGGGSSCT